MEIFSRETMVSFQRATLRYNPEDSTLRNHSCDNLKSYTCIFLIASSSPASVCLFTLFNSCLFLNDLICSSSLLIMVTGLREKINS
jgi:hypothetical protein